MKKQIIIDEKDYSDKHVQWEKTVIIIKWTHDYEKKIYIIEYKEMGS